MCSSCYSPCFLHSFLLFTSFLSLLPMIFYMISFVTLATGQGPLFPYKCLVGLSWQQLSSTQTTTLKALQCPSLSSALISVVLFDFYVILVSHQNHYCAHHNGNVLKKLTILTSESKKPFSPSLWAKKILSQDNFYSGDHPLLVAHQKRTILQRQSRPLGTSMHCMVYCFHPIPPCLVQRRRCEQSA